MSSKFAVLPLELFHLILTYLPLSFIFNHIIFLSKQIHTELLRRIANGLFFRERERGIFVEVLYGAHEHLEKSEPQKHLERLRKGYPQLYRDMHQIETMARTSKICAKLCMGLRQLARDTSKHLTSNYDSYNTLMKNITWRFDSFVNSSADSQYVQCSLDSPQICDRHVMLLFVTRYPHTFEKASPELQNDPEFVYAAASQCPDILRSASSKMRKNVDLIARLLQHNTSALKEMHPSLLDNPRIISIAVQYIPHYIHKASERLQNDETFMKELLIANPHVIPLVDLSWFSNSLQLMLEAVKVDATSFAFASEELKDNDELVAAAVRGDPEQIFNASERLRNTPEMMLLAVQQDGTLIRNASPSMRANKIVALAALKQDPCMLRYVHKSLRADRDVVRTAVEREGHLLYLASQDLQKCPEMFKIAQEAENR